MKKLFRQILITVTAFFVVVGFAQAYLIQPGDTLWKIANDNGTTVTDLVAINNIQNKDLIFVGQEIEIAPKLGIAALDIVALFEDNLSGAITSAATSMTLVRGTDAKTSTALSGTYGFIIDEGSTTEEFVVATCASTACTSLQRGISVSNGKTEVTALKFAHRKGATVKMTNWPVLGRLNSMLSGNDGIPATLYYDTEPVSPSSTALITKAYADALSYAGTPDMSVTAKGIGEQASATEAASTTITGGTTAPLVLTTALTTSTPYTTGKMIPVTENDGKLSQSFIDLADAYTWTGVHTFNGSQTKLSGPINTSSTIYSSSTATSTIPNLAVENFGASSTQAATSTFLNTVNFKDAIQHNGNTVSTGEYISTSACNGSCSVPAGTRMIVWNGGDNCGSATIGTGGITTFNAYSQGFVGIGSASTTVAAVPYYRTAPAQEFYALTAKWGTNGTFYLGCLPRGGTDMLPNGNVWFYK